MKRPVRHAWVAAALFSVAFCALVAWYVSNPRGQLLFAAFLSMPAGLLFFFVADAGWPPFLQMPTRYGLGVIQYAGLGYDLGVNRERGLPDRG